MAQPPIYIEEPWTAWAKSWAMAELQTWSEITPGDEIKHSHSRNKKPSSKTVTKFSINLKLLLRTLLIFCPLPAHPPALLGWLPGVSPLHYEVREVLWQEEWIRWVMAKQRAREEGRNAPCTSAVEICSSVSDLPPCQSCVLQFQEKEFVVGRMNNIYESLIINRRPLSPMPSSSLN